MHLASVVTSLFAGMLSAQLALFAGAARATENDPLSDLKHPGRVLVLRHANAPGVGDPASFRLGDCSTQRNLDAAGRRQAARLGERLRAVGVRRARIYSSQWCRCVETAQLLELGPVNSLPALNSFFARPQERERNVDALRNFLAALPQNGVPVILVTHQGSISALTGGHAASGGGVILKLDGSRVPRVLAEIPRP